MWFIYIQWTITQPWKEGNIAICSNMGRPRGYYAKWNKSDRERQILYDFTYMWNLENKAERLRHREQTGGCQRWGMGVG